MKSLVEAPFPLPDDYLVVPEQVNIASLTVDRHATGPLAEQIAIYRGEARLTYRELGRLVNRYGNALRGLGIERGDRVVLRLGMTVECMAALLGAMKIGAVPVPTSVMLGPQDLAPILANCDPVAAISSRELAGPLHEAAQNVSSLRYILTIEGDVNGFGNLGRLVSEASDELTAVPTHKDDLAFMLYTSGSTGIPKGVERAHRILIGGGDPNGKALMGLRPGDRVFHPHHDLSFSYPIGHGFLFPLYCGASIVLLPETTSTRMDPELIFRTIQDYRVTVFLSVATLYRRLLGVRDAETRFDTSSVRLWVTSAEPLPPDTLGEWRTRFGKNLYETLGQSEVPSFIGNIPGMEIRPGSLGKPFPGLTVKILDDNLRECPVGVPGHLAIRGDHPGLCSGYRKMPERWAEVYHDGWYFTRDYAYADKDGYFWYVSRTDDIIKSRGYSISPTEVENAIMGHPAVLEAGVAGAPDPILGQAVVAFVVLRPGHQASDALAEEIREQVKHTIAPYKAPKAVEFCERLPKTASGKLLRRALLEQAK